MPAALWLRRWVILTKRLVEAKGAAYDAALEKKKSVARWRKQNPPVARGGQAVMSRRMWLHQVHDDGPLDASGLPLHQAWAAYREGEGDLPLMSAGDVYSAGEATERELHEMQKEAGPGGSGKLSPNPIHNSSGFSPNPHTCIAPSNTWGERSRCELLALMPFRSTQPPTHCAGVVIRPLLHAAAAANPLGHAQAEVPKRCRRPQRELAPGGVSPTPFPRSEPTWSEAGVLRAQTADGSSGGGCAVRPHG